MECVIDFESLKGAYGEDIVKEISLAGEDVIQTFHFKSPYQMAPHGSKVNGLSWDDGHLEYDRLYTTLKEAVSGYAHLYAYGDEKTKILTEMLGRAVQNLESLGCPSPYGLKSDFSCSLPCHKNYLNIHCATRSAYNLYRWLMYHLLSRRYINCPPDSTRHTAEFNSGITHQ